MALFRQRGQLLGGTNIEIDVKGHGLDEVRDIASTVEQQVRTLPGVNFVRSSFEWGNPELQVAVDRQKVSDLGFSVSEVGYIVETLIAGTLAGTFREHGKERDLTLNWHRARGGADAGTGSRRALSAARRTAPSGAISPTSARRRGQPKSSTSTAIVPSSSP